MFRRSVLARVPGWGLSGAPGQNPARHPRIIGYHPEDHSCDYDLQMYTHPQVMRAWYTRHERFHAKNWAEMQQRTESHAYNAGLHFSGDGPFERELKRKGIQVEKYKLPSTVGIKRVHEMVVLRRRALEKKAEERLAAQRKKLAAEPPSWLDETDGPVNYHFVNHPQRQHLAEHTASRN